MGKKSKISIPWPRRHELPCSSPFSCCLLDPRATPGVNGTNDEPDDAAKASPAVPPKSWQVFHVESRNHGADLHFCPRPTKVYSVTTWRTNAYLQ